MSRCKVCGYELYHSISCLQKSENQIPYGKETISDWANHLAYCPACGVGINFYHHDGCDVEECPECHSRFISCSCVICSI